MKRMWSKNELKNQVNTQLASGEVPSVKANEIIENMSGYSASLKSTPEFTIESVFQGIVKNGNKLTLVSAFNITRTDTKGDDLNLVDFTIPSEIGAKLFPVELTSLQCLSMNKSLAMDSYKTSIEVPNLIEKVSDTQLSVWLVDASILNTLELNTPYYVRIEATFLLSDNLVSA